MSLKNIKLPYWLEHFLLFVLGQVIVGTGTYLAGQNFGANTALIGGVVSTAVKALLDMLRKIDPTATLPASPVVSQN